MLQVGLERGKATAQDLVAALDLLGVKEGQTFVVMSERHRNELVRETGRQMADEGARGGTSGVPPRADGKLGG